MAKKRQEDPATAAFWEGYGRVFQHPLFKPFDHVVRVYRSNHTRWECPDEEWAVVTSNGDILAHPRRRGSADNWAWVLAHCLLHLGLGHFREHADQKAWNLACDEVVASFLRSLKLGTPPKGYIGPPQDGASADEEKRYRFHQGRRSEYQAGDLIFLDKHRENWESVLAEGLRQAAAQAVAVAAGHENPKRSTRATRARDWFMTSYPLLGALASSFELVEDPRICEGLDIQIAAVDEEAGTIFLNAAVPLQEAEVRFVMAHEMLHAGLLHGVRCQGRDPYVWNVACDFVINGWLIEMGVGEAPQLGVMYDPALQGMSAEQVYDQIICDARKWGTLAGPGRPDIIRPRGGDFCDLDDFYRRCLQSGLQCHQEQARGFLPLGLLEAIRALSHPPLRWDVELARWFDLHFPLLERRRTYARPSRRQSSTPDLPRPQWFPPLELEGRTFAVVLDTSGSMGNRTLAKALGAIASYAASRDVPACRVVFCDAAPYDQGYMTPESIAGRVQVRGRGGTTLQPALDLLERAPDFPKKGPILIITDGMCDRLSLGGRPHAYLLPGGASLPFPPKGELFRIE